MTIVSVIGVKGDKGPRGVIGKQGMKGKPGKRGELIVDHIFIVEVESDNNNNIILVIDEISKKEITLYRGHSYIFDQSEESNLDSSGNLQYHINLYTHESIKENSTFHKSLTGDSNHKNMFEVSNDAPEELYYHTGTITNSGGKIKIKTLLPENKDVAINIGLPADTDKANLEEAYQPVIGMSSKYTVSGGDIMNGQPMIQYFTNGTISATGISGEVPPVWKFIGIATNSAAIGNVCTIVHDGFVTARFEPQYVNSIDSWEFDKSIVNSTITLIKETKFTHANADISSNVHYTITFDAGEGNTIDYTINSLYFNHNYLTPRLGWQYSDDDNEYTTPKLIGWHRSYSSRPPGSNKYYQGGNYQGDISGYIFPNLIQRIKDLNGSLTGTFNSRYIKFFYYSSKVDTDEASWDITLNINPAVESHKTVLITPIYTPLYLNPNDFTKLTTDPSSNIIVGYCANTDTINNSIYMRVSTNK